ncbi:MAG: hypothetical protein Q8P16_02420 [bacterium]|nr:hypothetical protein [bacterium]
MSTNKLLIAIVVVAVAAAAAYLFWPKAGEAPENGEAAFGQQQQNEPQANGAGEEPEFPSAGAVANGLVGTWQSNEDAKFKREFNADGTVTDTYEGENAVASHGEWEVFTDPSAEPVEVPDIPGATYVRLVFDEETVYFIVPEITESNLVMIYLGRGGALTFTRVK